MLSLIERRARCSCDLCSRLFAHFTLSLILSSLGESLGLVPGVFGVDSLLMLPTLQRGSGAGVCVYAPRRAPVQRSPCFGVRVLQTHGEVSGAPTAKPNERTELVQFLVQRLRDFHDGKDLIPKQTAFEAGKKPGFGWVSVRVRPA